MKTKYKVVLSILLLIAAGLLTVLFLQDKIIAVLEPKGLIAEKERDLIVIATLLMLIVVIPVFIITLVFAWKYREGNKEAKYTPDWADQPIAEAIWWGLPFVIIIFLSVLTWKSSQELDPFKPIHTGTKPLTIQVVALQWKWLFIYPEQKIATINFIQFPEKTPLSFEVTADAPMNSFWIPQLGSQIYAMPGMKSKVHLIAAEPGDFRGCSANLSGEGFAGMTFTARASSETEFETWVRSAQDSSLVLDMEEYNKLVEPSSYDPVKLYKLEDENLHEQIVMKFLMPQQTQSR